MNDTDKLAALRERHRRLEATARAVVKDARQYGDGDQALVTTYLLRKVIRELDGEPQPSALATMSVS